jgi:acyl dehydratase
MDMKVNGGASESLVLVGETIRKTLRYTRDDIAHFARLTHDANPLHREREAALHAGFPDVIAAGQHTSAIMTGLMATYFSRDDDGIKREMLCLNLNFAYKHPVFADRELEIVWRVAATQYNGKLGGTLAHIDGTATQEPGKPSVIARGTVLVKHGE